MREQAVGLLLFFVKDFMFPILFIIFAFVKN